MPARKPPESQSIDPLDDEPQPPVVSRGDAETDASRRRSALDGLHRYFRDQDDQQRPADPRPVRPTIPVAEMVVLIRNITASLDECRYAEPTPTIRAVDADGCNWDMPSWDGDEDRYGDCKALVSGAIESLRARYNLS